MTFRYNKDLGWGMNGIDNSCDLCGSRRKSELVVHGKESNEVTRTVEFFCGRKERLIRDLSMDDEDLPKFESLGSCPLRAKYEELVDFAADLREQAEQRLQDMATRPEGLQRVDWIVDHFISLIRRASAHEMARAVMDRELQSSDPTGTRSP